VSSVRALQLTPLRFIVCRACKARGRPRSRAAHFMVFFARQRKEPTIIQVSNELKPDVLFSDLAQTVSNINIELSED
jgi:hypothetical protein